MAEDTTLNDRSQPPAVSAESGSVLHLATLVILEHASVLVEASVALQESPHLCTRFNAPQKEEFVLTSWSASSLNRYMADIPHLQPFYAGLNKRYCLLPNRSEVMFWN